MHLCDVLDSPTSPSRRSRPPASKADTKYGLTNAVINALTVVGRLMGMVAIVAAASPTFEGWIEDVFVRIFYGASVHGAHKHA